MSKIDIFKRFIFLPHTEEKAFEKKKIQKTLTLDHCDIYNVCAQKKKASSSLSGSTRT